MAAGVGGAYCRGARRCARQRDSVSADGRGRSSSNGGRRGIGGAWGQWCPCPGGLAVFATCVVAVGPHWAWKLQRGDRGAAVSDGKIQGSDSSWSAEVVVAGLEDRGMVRSRRGRHAVSPTPGSAQARGRRDGHRDHDAGDEWKQCLTLGEIGAALAVRPAAESDGCGYRGLKRWFWRRAGRRHVRHAGRRRRRQSVGVEVGEACGPSFGEVRGGSLAAGLVARDGSWPSDEC